MRIPVHVEQRNAQHYRAHSKEPVELTADGTSRAEALDKLRSLLESHLVDRPQATPILLAPDDQPWSRFAGTWAGDDPLIAEWQQAVEEYRLANDEHGETPYSD